MNGRNSELRLVLGAAILAASALSCGDEEEGPGFNVPGADIRIEAEDGVDHGMMMEIAFPAETILELERSFNGYTKIRGVFEDGVTVDFTQGLTVESSNVDVIEVGATTADGFELMPKAIGEATLTASIGDLVAQSTFNVVRPGVTSLALEEVTPVGFKTVGELRAVATLRDGTEEDVTMEATWSSSDDLQVKAFDDAARKGLNFARGRMIEATITAAIDGQSASMDVAVPCSLELGSLNIEAGSIMPNGSWPNAIMYDTEDNRSQGPLSIEDMMCDSRFDGIRAFVFSLNAGWCGPCHGWMNRISAAYQQTQAEGIMPVYVVGDTLTRNTFSLATAEYADRLSSQHTSNSWGLRFGNAETENLGASGVRQILNTTGGWPSIFIVRRSDMSVVSLGGNMDVASAIQTVNLNTGGSNSGPSVETCPDGVENENSEPNDVSKIAFEVGLGQFEGAICSSSPDFFRVKADGPWTITVEFVNSTADIDIFAWDEAADAALQEDGATVGSFATARNFESLERSGEELIRINSKGGRKAAYTVTIEPR